VAIRGDAKERCETKVVCRVTIAEEEARMRRLHVIVDAGLVMALIVNAGVAWAHQSQPLSSLPQQFDALMQMLNQRALDMGKDGLSEAIQRQAAVDQAISVFRRTCMPRLWTGRRCAH
jgi:hypothetical protein